MLFAFYGLDKPDSEALRLAQRPAHVAFLEALGDTLVSAGPLLAADGTAMIGSLLILDAPDRVAVDAVLATDPYAKAGLFQSVAVHPWRRVFPRPA